ncbi:MAG: PAS domain S-box protein [Armatimonadia bacterium]|nr:PAS domain S-box protein [Armatimonadia bacterium]
MSLAEVLDRHAITGEARRALEDYFARSQGHQAGADDLARAYTALLASDDVLVASLGEDLTIDAISRAAAGLRAATPSGLSGRPFLQHFASLSGSRESLLASLHSTGHIQVTGRHLDAHDRARVVTWRIDRTDDRAGGAATYVAFGEDVTHARRAERLLTSLVAGTSDVSGREFLESLVVELSRSDECDTAYVATVHGSRATAIAVARNGEPLPAFVYELGGTPCEEVSRGVVRIHPSGVANLFPEASVLTRSRAVSYAGCPLSEGEGPPVGILVALGEREFDHPEQVEFILRLFARRATLELGRARDREALGASEQRFRAVFEGSADAQFLLDERGILDCNRATVEIFGAEDAKDLVDQHPGQLSPDRQPDGTPSPLAASRRIAEALVNGSARFEWVHRRLDGTPFDAEIVLTGYELEGRRVLLAVVRDVSERKRVEAALAESQRRLELAIRGGDVGLWDWDHSSDTIVANERAWMILGHQPGDTHSTRGEWLERVHPDDRSGVESAVREHLDGEASHYEAEYRMRAADGAWVWVLDRGQVVDRDSDGQPLRSAGTYLNVTERKAAEHAAGRYLEQLRAATAQVAMAQEEERRRIASGLHDSVAQLLVGAGLELTTLQGQLEQEGAARSLAEAVELLGRAADQVRSLTFEISPPLLYDVGLGAALEWYASRLEAESGVPVIAVDLTEGEPRAVAHRTLLFDCARELMINALKHADADEIRVLLERQERDIVLTVSDDGKGFSPEEAGPDMSEMRHFGLFNIRERIHRSGGAAEFGSAPGFGTTVRLSLPLTGDAT